MQLLSLIFLPILAYFCLACPTAKAQDHKQLDIFLNGKYYSIDYRIHAHHGKHKRIVKKDYVTFHIETRNADNQPIKSTFGKKPIVKEISNDDYTKVDKGFLEDILLTLHKEDSATFWIPEYMLFEAIKHPRPKIVSAGSTITYHIKVLKVQNKEEAENDENQLIHDQRQKDEKAIAQYVAKNKLTNLKKTYSGIWYVVDKEGEGEFAQKGDVVAVRYVGKFLDGTVFGSSDDDGRLFEFPVGEKFAMQAFDEMLVLIKKGGKVTFITPSYLAYQEFGMAKIVPPHTPLVFEIEYMEMVANKITIENKGEILEKERKKVDDDKKAKALEAQKQKEKEIEKDAEKRGLIKKD